MGLTFGTSDDSKTTKQRKHSVRRAGLEGVSNSRWDVQGRLLVNPDNSCGGRERVGVAVCLEAVRISLKSYVGCWGL
jgi:hypothetical protein